jgi:hypothetical protein
MSKEKQPEKPKGLSDKEFAAKYDTGKKIDFAKVLNKLVKTPPVKPKK